MKHLNTTQRIALVVAGAIAAFALVMIGAVAGRVTLEAQLLAVTPTPLPEPTVAPTPGPDPAVQALIDERDAAYQAIIAEANRRLELANERLQAARATAAAPVQIVAPARPVASPKPAYLSPEQAASIALGIAPGATVTKTPELVNFQGKVAYEVVLDRGSVYVDALSGQVLYNGAAVQQVVSSGGSGGEREGGDGGDHEGGGDD